MNIAASTLFGERLELAQRYAEHLATSGVERGLVGPREAGRVWERHVLNCAVVAELVPHGARLLDIGSGAGLPGIPLALARPDLRIVLIEPLVRRVDWLVEILGDLELDVTVQRGRAEETAVRRRWEGADVVTARAVAPLARLAGWALPLLRPGGRLLAMKGETADAEVARDAAAMRAFGAGSPVVLHCGHGIVDPPTTVVVVEQQGRMPDRPARRKKGRSA